MSEPLRLLLILESANDSKLVLQELRRGGYKPVYTKIETAEAMSDALQKQEWNMIIADPLMPRCNGREALEVVKACGSDVPLIMLSAEGGEESIVAAMHAGARDYVTKQNLGRLIPVVRRELEEFSARREAREADIAIREGEVFYREELESDVESRTAELQYAIRMLIREIEEHKKAEEAIKTSLHLKEILIREIHHRIKNNLQTVTALLALQSKNLTDPMAVQFFRESQNRIRSIALVHEQLYRAQNIEKVNFSQYLHTLISNLVRTHGINTDEVELRVNTAEVMMSLDEALPCGLIVNELVSNALRHAFPEGGTGKINVSFNRDDVVGYVLQVVDNGIGLPPDFEERKTSTLGMQIIQSLTQQLEGTLEISSQQGACFRLTFLAPKRTTKRNL